jgi:hypothetical protein
MSRLRWLVVILWAAMASASDGFCRAADALSLGEGNIATILDTPTQLRFVETPFRDVIRDIKVRSKIDIRIDAQAMNEAGVTLDTQVTKNLKGIPLRSALRIMLQELGLCYIVEGEGLLIVSPEIAANQRVTRAYPVEDLVTLKHQGQNSRDSNATCDALIKAITATIDPESWTIPAALRPEQLTTEHKRNNSVATSIVAVPIGAPKTLVVKHNADVQQQIAEMLACLRRVKPGDGTQRAGIARDPTAAEKKIDDALDLRADLDFNETPLKDVVDELEKRFKIEILRDIATFKEGSLGAEDLVTRSFRNVPLRAALRQMLGDLEFTFIIQDEVLLITTPKVAAGRLSTRVYPLPLDTERVLVDTLLRDIRELQPRHSRGGVAAVDLAVSILIVRETPKVHQQIAKHLAGPEFR